MFSRKRRPLAADGLVAGLSLVLLALPALGQDTAVVPPDEPLVFERLVTRYDFQEDGSGTYTIEAKILVQTEGGVQLVGQLAFPYSSDSEGLHVRALGVVRPDGSVVRGSTANRQDLPAPVLVEYPQYTDLRIAHLTVPPIRPGDRLLYEIEGEIHTPYVPGQFWIGHAFHTGYVVEEVLELRTPAARATQQHSEGIQGPSIAEAEGRRTFTWTWTHTPTVSDTEVEGPTVLASSFEDWDEVAAWYQELQKDRLQTSRRMRKKLGELTDGLESPDQKLAALYRHVSQEYRYLGLQFGMGRYQPHMAAQVFDSGYGDCKDKHTLLAAMAEELGFEVRPVLVNTMGEIVPHVPMPAQFDHVITAVQRDEGWLLLDSTPIASPFGYLGAEIRGKTALIVHQDGSAELYEVPQELPYRANTVTTVTGQLSALGRLTANVAFELRGDDEVVLRHLLLYTSNQQLQQFLQQFMLYQGVQGEVSGMAFSDPLQTEEPLRMDLTLEQPNAWTIDGETRRFQTPFPGIEFWDPPTADSAEAEWPQLSGESVASSSFEIRLPEGFEGQPPLPVKLDREFATYESTYSVEGQLLRGSRKLRIHTSEMSPAQFESWRAFRRTVEADAKQFFNLTASGSADPAAIADIEELFEAGKAAKRQNQDSAAIPLLERVTELDPQHVEAWFELGRAYGGEKRWGEAEAAFRQVCALAPYHAQGYKTLGWALWQQQRIEDAVAAFTTQLENDPLDHYSTQSVGILLNQLGRHAEAVASLDRALTLEPGHSWTLSNLMVAYLGSSQFEAARERLEEFLASAPSVAHLNPVAELALQHDELNLALELFELAAEKEPDNLSIWWQIYKASRTAGRMPEALEAIRKCAELDPGDADYPYFLGVEYVRIKDYASAVTPLERALEMAPDDQDIREALAGTYRELGRQEEARALMREVYAGSPRYSAENLSLIERWRVEARMFDGALREARQLMESDVEEATRRYEEVLGQTSHPALTSQIAYYFAYYRVQLPKAHELAFQAATELEAALADVTIDSNLEETNDLISLVLYAWLAKSTVLFMELDVAASAEVLAPAMWLAPSSRHATELGQMQEQLGREQAARQSYGLAMIGGGAATAANNRLNELIGYQAIQPFKADLEAQRLNAATVRYRLPERIDAKASVRVLVEGNGSVADIALISGDEQALPTPEMLAGERFDLRLPVGRVNRLLLKAESTCSQYAPECKLVLELPALRW